MVENFSLKKVVPVKPPRVTLSSLNTGEVLWKQTGVTTELKAKDTYGSENFGSSAVTTGGVIFIAATR